MHLWFAFIFLEISIWRSIGIIDHPINLEWKKTAKPQASDTLPVVVAYPHFGRLDNFRWILVRILPSPLMGTYIFRRYIAADGCVGLITFKVGFGDKHSIRPILEAQTDSYTGWLVVDLPLWKIWVRQLGWWNSMKFPTEWKVIKFHGSKPATRSPSYSHCCWFIAYENHDKTHQPPTRIQTSIISITISGQNETSVATQKVVIPAGFTNKKTCWAIHTYYIYIHNTINSLGKSPLYYVYNTILYIIHHPEYVWTEDWNHQPHNHLQFSSGETWLNSLVQRVLEERPTGEIMVLKRAAAHAHVMSDIFILLKTQTPSRITGGICRVCSIWSLPTFDFTRDIYIYVYTPWIYPGLCCKINGFL